MRIRFIKLKEINEFYDLFAELITTGFPEYSKELQNYHLTRDFFYSKSVFRSDLKEGWQKIFGAWQDKTGLVGFLVIDKPYGGVCYVSWLGIKSKWQGMGIGRKLVATLEKWAKKSGVHQIYCAVDKRNVGFYKKLEFKHYGIWKKGWFGLTWHLMGKIIDEPKLGSFFR